jgi:hypothetical protein
MRSMKPAPMNSAKLTINIPQPFIVATMRSDAADWVALTGMIHSLLLILG